MKTEYAERELREREEIVNDLGSSMFLEAGAGAGKTHILTERITRQLAAGTAAADQIVAITFTNKAAQELKSRITGRVRSALHQAEEGTEEKDNLRRALRELDRMQISTIHSFCLRLLTEQSFLAGLRMDMELLEDREEREEKEAFFRQWYRDRSDEEIRRIRDNFDGKMLVDVMKNAFLQICELPAETEVVYDRALAERTLQSFLDEAAEMKRAFALIVLDLIGERWGARPESLREAAKADYFLSDIKKIALREEGGETEFLKAVCREDARYFKSRKKYTVDDSTADSRACRVRFLEENDPERLMKEIMAYHHALIMAFILPCREAYMRRHSNRRITNDLLLQKARDLVKDHPEARAVFREKFRCIYVDEFQDTDHVQADLIFALCSDEEGRLRPGSLFVVGDPKQSIYRFRGADLPLYYRIRERMAGMDGCRLFSMSINFRSGPEVIEFVNRNGERLLPGYRGMICGQERPERMPENGVLSGVYTAWDPKMSPECQFSWNLDCDREAVADVIARLVGAGTGIWDREKACFRPLRYRDFLVLCYGQPQMERYLETMVARDIPVSISGSMPMAGAREAQRFAALYRFLAFPDYPRAAAGAMQAVLDTPAGPDGLRPGTARLERLRSLTEGTAGTAMAVRLARHPEYWLDWDRTVEKHYLQRAQAQIQQMIETVSADTPDETQALSEAFEAYLSGTVDRELTLSREADAVRLMNLHKAKGLEGQVVIVCKRSEDFSFRESSLQEKKEGEEGYLYCCTAEGKTEEGFTVKRYPGYVLDEELKARAEREELAEYRRLEYVEATRAMQALILMPPFDPAGGDEYSFRGYSFEGCRTLGELLGGPYQVLSEAAWAAEDEPVPSADRVLRLLTEGIGEKTGSIPEPYDFGRRGPGFSAEQGARTWLRLTPSSLETDAEPTIGEIPENAGRPAGALFGTVMHRAFELLVREMRKTGLTPGAEARGRCAAQAVMESWEELEESCGDACDAEAERYRGFLGRVLEDFTQNSDLPGLVLRAERVYAEMPFSFLTSAGQDGAMFEALRGKVTPDLAARLLPPDPDTPVWVSGKADLVLVGADGTVTVADYKSDRNPGLDPEVFRASVERRYGGQMELYRRVCAKLFGVPAEMVSGRFYTI